MEYMCWNRTLALVLTAILAGVVTRSPAVAKPTAAEQAPTAPGEDILASLYEQGQAHLYNLDYEEALAVFDRSLYLEGDGTVDTGDVPARRVRPAQVPGRLPVRG